LGIVVFLYVVAKYLPEQERINEYISDSYEDLEKIKQKIAEGECFQAIDLIKGYETRYSDGCLYEECYKKLPEEMRAEKVCPRYLGVMVQVLDGNINEYLPKLKSFTFNTSDSDEVSAIVNGLSALHLGYPDGVTYTTENGEKLTYDIGKMYSQYYYSFRCEEIILNYRIADKSMKHYEISNMMSLAKVEYLNPELRSRVSSQIAQMKSENRATDFAVTGGSAEVYLMKDYNGEYIGNYGWICPKCGYDGGAVGAPVELSVEGHYIGETEILRRMMICAGAMAGGCGGLSEYTIEITYK